MSVIRRAGSWWPRLLALFSCAWAMLFASVSCGCAGALAEAEGQFAEGEYPAADHALARLEIEARSWTGRRRAEYALYRGLTTGALGDEQRAGRWLREARQAELAHPGALPPEDAARLLVVVDAYDLGLPDAPPGGEHARAMTGVTRDAP